MYWDDFWEMLEELPRIEQEEKEMIEKLEPVLEHCSDGVVREYPPYPFMLMEKINELVEAVNRMEKQIEKLQVL